MNVQQLKLLFELKALQNLQRKKKRRQHRFTTYFMSC